MGDRIANFNPPLGLQRRSSLAKTNLRFRGAGLEGQHILVLEQVVSGLRDERGIATVGKRKREPLVVDVRR